MATEAGTGVDKYLAYLNVRISFLERLFISSQKSSIRRQAYIEKKALLEARDKYMEYRT